MKRFACGLLAVALVLTLGKTAMGYDFGEVMGSVAREKCWRDIDGSFGQAVAMFPYFPEQGQWWSGLAMINLHETDTIPSESLCLVGVNAAGEGFVKEYRYPIYPQNIKTILKEDIDPRQEKWKDALYIGVYRIWGYSGPSLDRNFRVFAMMGDSQHGHGTFFLPKADENKPAIIVRLNYFPGTGWWSGVAVVNTASATARLKFSVVQDGLKMETERVSIAARRMAVLTPDSVNQQAGEQIWNPALPAVIRITKADGESDLAIYAFAMFGNGSEAAGYVGEKHE